MWITGQGWASNSIGTLNNNAWFKLTETMLTARALQTPRELSPMTDPPPLSPLNFRPVLALPRVRFIVAILFAVEPRDTNVARL